MSALRWRAPLSLLLLLGGRLLSAAGRKQGAAGVAAESASGSAGGSSGRVVSPERHTCSWQLLPPAPGPAARSEQARRCRGPDGARRQCAYRGEPGRCALCAARRPRSWKQVPGGLRQKRRPCLDPAPLRARLRARQKGRGAELRLVPPAFPVVSPTAAAGLPRDPKPRARSRGQPREPALGPAAGAPPPPSAPPKGKPPEQKPKAGTRKAAREPDEERPPGTGPERDALDENAKLADTYCAEKWHSLCNFFVSFWNG